MSPPPKLETNCVLCCGRISDRRESQLQSKALATWKDKCVSSFSEVLELESSACRTLGSKTNFCPSCLQLIRDIDFVFKSIHRFEKKLGALKLKARFLLNNNIRRLEKATHLYAKTVRSIVKPVKEEKLGQKRYDGNASLNSEESNPASTSSSRSNRNRRPTSRYHDYEQPSSTPDHDTDTEIKQEIESDNEETHNFNVKSDNDPDFDIGNDEGDEPYIETKVKVKPQRAKPRENRSFKNRKYRSKNYISGKLYCTYPNCEAYFLKPPALQAHILKEHENDPTPFHCQKCDHKFKYLATLQTHMGVAHGKQLLIYSCNECPRSFRSKPTLKMHISRYHSGAAPDKHECPVCKKEYNNEDELKGHVDLHNVLSQTEDRFRCVLCNAHHFGVMELQMHMRKEHTEGEFKCPEPGCSKAFQKKQSLTWHITRLHRAVFKPHLACPKCPYCAPAPGALKRHMYKHWDKLLFPCTREGCERAFKYNSARNRHIALVHDKNVRKYPCTLCPKICLSTSALNLHQAHHSSIRAFLCEHCSLGFKSLHNLKNHYKVHQADTKGRRVPALQKPRKDRLPPVDPGFQRPPSELVTVTAIQPKEDHQEQQENGEQEVLGLASYIFPTDRTTTMDLSEIEPCFQY